MRQPLARAVLAATLLVCAASLRAADASAALRRSAQQSQRDGNFREAYDAFRKLMLDQNTDPLQVGTDLGMALNCLQRLNRVQDSDGLLEAAVAAHSKNRHLLQQAARLYLELAHYGFLVAGEFRRGHHRGGGLWVDCSDRDRVRALQLLEQALATKDGTAAQHAKTCLSFAQALLRDRGARGAWRLQTLTDLSALPDYEPRGPGIFRGGGRIQGAPVNESGQPVLHQLPDSFTAAASDGERWRWLLMQAAESDPDSASTVQLIRAQFLYEQFGTHTLARQGPLPPGLLPAERDEPQAAGTFTLHTLNENETIAWLATGIRRFELPDEFHFIRLFRAVADSNDARLATTALERLGALFENRRQYERALVYWKRLQPRNPKLAAARIEQIIRNWGTFEPVATQPAGRGATVEYRFRNGNGVRFEAHRIRLRLLLDDTKAYIKSNPKPIQRDRINLSNIGYRLVRNNELRYRGAKVAEWRLDLEPRPRHFDRRITVHTPLQESGAYLLTARMEGGNASRIVIWVSDTVIVRKPLADRMLCFVADAVTGAPLDRALVEFFGWRRNRARNTRQVTVSTQNFAEYTDADGQVFLTPDAVSPRYRWLTVATTADGRLAYHGFSGVWYAREQDRDHVETKAFVITDRPVYRPAQTVHLKAWVRTARYDLAAVSTFAGNECQVRILNPRGDVVLETTRTADAHGGLDTDLVLDAEAVLGVYRCEIRRARRVVGNGHFRVEEYKKPEFEVTIDAPDKPVMLGETVTATVRATYYFGAPVTEATVRYKVLRHAHKGRWYPPAPWDWLYGNGYGWFARQYDWYPGWSDWGCPPPPAWWLPRPPPPPEVVMEQETPIRADGTVAIAIDTAVARELHGDLDHRYEISAEVRDASRRTVLGTGSVLVARRPFAVHAWVDRGHYRTGDTVHAEFRTRTLDGRPVPGQGRLRLLRVTYDADRNPVETEVEAWTLDPDPNGEARRQLSAARPGQYRLSYAVTDDGGHRIEGGYLFAVRGTAADPGTFRFNHLELVADKREYAPGEDLNLLINTNRPQSTVLLFLRPADGVYPAPTLLRLNGKSTVVRIPVTPRDMPNFFVEALTVANGRVHTELRGVPVPPEQRVLNVAVTPAQEQCRPGAETQVRLKLTDHNGEPVTGSVALSVYDRSVEAIAGGSNVPEIQPFFWKWRRHHNPRTESSLNRWSRNLLRQGETPMAHLGVFGHLVADEFGDSRNLALGRGGGGRPRTLTGQRAARTLGGAEMKMAAAAPGNIVLDAAEAAPDMAAGGVGGGAAAADTALVQPTIRTEFADTALWIAALETDPDGFAEVLLPLPQDLTAWTVKAWAMAHGTRVGQGQAQVTTAKDLMLRLQAPRFFVQKDEVVLSANIHNALGHPLTVRAVLELEGPCLEALDGGGLELDVPANGEKRVDWRVKVVREGEAIIRMLALTDSESDAVEKRFPVFVHGADKLVPVCGVIRPQDRKAEFTVTVPEARRPETARLEVRYSPSLALAMLDAVPYLLDYPYGCTEQTLNRFLPAVLAQKSLQQLGIDLESLRDKRTNLNAQELGPADERAGQWQRRDVDPVFDLAEMQRIVRSGVERLTSMQLTDGGWGWFSGFGEHAYPHTTAVVVHGLLTARDNDVAIPPAVIRAGVDWLDRYQQQELRKLENGAQEPRLRPWKRYADNLDALVYKVLDEDKRGNPKLGERLYDDRNQLSLYGKALLGLAFQHQGENEKAAMLLRNIEQYRVDDPENQTGFLNLGNDSFRWHWYGSEIETHAAYLQLLVRMAAAGNRAADVVKYLLNNRKHGTYWNATRDTALCVEAFAEYLRASGETSPNMTVRVLIDGEERKQVRIDSDNLFTFDNALVLKGDELGTGDHIVQLRKQGTGPLYFNGYLQFFTLEDPIGRAGLEIKVQRRVYRLIRVGKEVDVAGARGQATRQQVEKYERQELANLDSLKSGDLVEVELIVESKNDYEYIVVEDCKAAGFEPVALRSGYNGNDLGAYMELRDEKVSFFVRRLARGRHSVAYRLRAEVPGRFSALPARAFAMYAPELRANSAEIKLRIQD